ncbi:MAG: hypothetical protein JXB49_04780 [Bacteroidales bacterium]|nr:hypothetical protein [Bacteroidales bacterium]
MKTSNDIPKVKNIVQLRDDLLQVYEGLRNHKLSTEEVKQSANVSGKIFSSAKIQIEYNKMIGSKDKIPFLEP